jgi:hypothetical protein
LFHFEADQEYLRGTVFYDLFKDALVFEDFWQAIDYRKYLTACEASCPVLYALDGRKVDGTLDPNYSVHSSRLEYSFGEYFSGRERLEKLQTGK